MRFKAALRLTFVFAFATLLATPGFAAAGRCEDLFAAPVDNIAALTPSETRALESLQEIKVMSFNVMMLFEKNVDENGVQHDGKPAVDQQGVAKAILDENADFIILEEVGGLETLQHFVSNFLGGQYEAFLTKGNDSAGIDIGYLVKRDLPLSFEIESHRDAVWNDPTDHETHKVFSRDAPALMVRAKTASKDSAPLMILIGHHAKAMRDRTGDPQSNMLREAQHKKIGEIIDGYRDRFGAGVPILLGGDFNTNVQTSPEIDPIRDRLVDPFDIKKVSETDRVTHTFHPKEGPAVQKQMDAVFITPEFADNVIDIEAYRYKKQNGEEKRIPASFDERKQNPSDHFPVVLTLSTKKIFKKAVGL